MGYTLKVDWALARTSSVIGVLEANGVDAKPLYLYLDKENPASEQTIKLDWTQEHLDQAEAVMEEYLKDGPARVVLAARSGDGWQAAHSRVIELFTEISLALLDIRVYRLVAAEALAMLKEDG